MVTYGTTEVDERSKTDTIEGTSTESISLSELQAVIIKLRPLTILEGKFNQCIFIIL